MKKGLILGALLTMLIVLTGCMKADCDININRDGSGVLDIAILYNNDFLKDKGDLKQSIEELKNRGFEVQDYKTETQTGYKGSKKVASFEEWKTLLNEITGGGNSDENQGFEFEKEENKLIITGKFDFSQAEAMGMSKVLKQVELNINIKSPFKVIENNAIKHEKGVYSWKIDLTAKNEIKYIADTRNTLVLMGSILGMVVLILIIVIVLAVRRRKKKKELIGEKNIIPTEDAESGEVLDELEQQSEINPEEVAEEKEETKKETIDEIKEEEKNEEIELIKEEEYIEVDDEEIKKEDDKK
ncbi:MAG: hypothetical protein A2Y22_07640 [Clostridiales bacterium GWD2_32_59]|nr:MAG: hypothetical protein A2Y22_07640 [Clostridiales bacterium GWD2_32_59]